MELRRGGAGLIFRFLVEMDGFTQNSISEREFSLGAPPKCTYDYVPILTARFFCSIILLRESLLLSVKGKSRDASTQLPGSVRQAFPTIFIWEYQ